MKTSTVYLLPFILLLQLTIMGNRAEAQTRSITTNNLAASKYCPGATASVTFTIAGTFNTNNVFTAQLSNSAGEFPSNFTPVAIGSVSSLTASPISVTIPANTPAGTYRVRVMSNRPAVTGSTSASFTVGTAASISAGGPTTFCPGGSVTLTASGGGTYLWSTGATTSSITVSTTGNYTVTATADGCSGTSPVTNVTVQDIAAPVPDVASLPDLVGQCSVTATAPTATDACQGPVTATTSDPTTYSTLGTYTITWRYTDNYGNTRTQTQKVKVQDQVAPQFTTTVPDVTVACNASTAPAATGTPVAGDNCATPTLTYSDVSNQNSDPSSAAHYNYIISRTWKATDAAGLSASFVQRITVQDVTAPVPDVITLPTLTGECSVTATAPTATDACQGAITATTADPTSYSAQGSYTIHWTYTDASGNSSSQSQQVVVQDVTAPAFTYTPGDLTVNCSSSTAPSETGVATAGDNCGSATVDYSDVSTQDSDPATVAHYNYTITRTWTAKDGVGLTATHVQTITVQDQTAPSFTFTPTDVTIACSASAAPSATGTATASDNCTAAPVVGYSDQSTQSSDVTASGHYNYVITRTWTATDIVGRSATYVQTITVEDKTAPTFTATPQDVTVACNGSIQPSETGTATAADECQESPQVSFADVSTQDADATVAGHYNYTITRTWTASDASGNSRPYVQTITVQDIVAPVADVADLPDLTGECSVSATAPTATDACQGKINATTSDPTSYTEQGNYTITWTYSDASGNSSTQTQKVVVKDLTPPQLTYVPGGLTVGCSSSTAPSATGTATASDNCGTATVTYQDQSTQSNNPLVAGYYNYTITRTWTATDGAGLTASNTQTIVVQDVTKPDITCPADKLNVPVDFDQDYATIDIGTATASDNCVNADLLLVTNDNLITNQQYPLGTTTVKWTAVDRSGNSSNCTQTITVRKRQVGIVYSGTASVQYSDIINLNAVLADLDGSGTKIEGRSVVYTLSANGVTVRTKTVTTNADGEARDTLKADLKPGAYSLKADFAGDAHFAGASATTGLQVLPENAVFVYSGSGYFSTPGTSNPTGSVVLGTSINDINDGPDTRGDIRKAKVTFTSGSGGATLGAANNVVGLVDPGVLTDGLSSTSFNYTLTTNEQSGGGRTWEVWTKASDHYVGDAGPSLVTLALPGQDYVTGGGHYVMSSSAGTYAGTPGARMNFGFTMKWNKSGKNLQGQINLIFRRQVTVNGVPQWRVYQVKSNAISSMAVRSEAGYGKAVISTKANLTDITDPLLPVSLGGGHQLTLEAWDLEGNGGGTYDKVGAMLVENGTGNLLFASSWSSGRMQVETISGGNVNVRSNTAPVAAPVTKTIRMAPGSDPDNADPALGATVFPNPSRSVFTLRLPPQRSGATVQVILTDAGGRVLQAWPRVPSGQTLQIGAGLKAGTYYIELRQGGRRQVLPVIRL